MELECKIKSPTMGDLNSSFIPPQWIIKGGNRFRTFSVLIVVLICVRIGLMEFLPSFFSPSLDYPQIFDDIAPILSLLSPLSAIPYGPVIIDLSLLFVSDTSYTLLSLYRCVT